MPKRRGKELRPGKAAGVAIPNALHTSYAFAGGEEMNRIVDGASVLALLSSHVVRASIERSVSSCLRAGPGGDRRDALRWHAQSRLVQIRNPRYSLYEATREPFEKRIRDDTERAGKP